MIEAFLSCTPPTVTAQQKRWRCVNGIPMAYDNPRMKQARKLYKTLLTPHKPKEPLQGPLMLQMRFEWPWRKTEKAAYKKGPYRFHDKGSPDLDNAEKSLLDAMEACGFFANDGQIASKHSIKAWGANPGIYFKLKPLVEDWKE